MLSWFSLSLSRLSLKVWSTSCPISRWTWPWSSFFCSSLFLRFELQYLSTMLITRVVIETVLELSECRGFLWWFLFFRRNSCRSCSRRKTTCPLRHLFRNGLCLNALQVDLLHRLKFHVGLRVATRAPTELAELVVLVKVKLRALEVLINVLAKHLFEVTFALVTPALLGVNFTRT